MRAAVVTDKCKLQIMELGEPNITKSTQIKIKVTSGAICNTTDNKVFATSFPEQNWPNESFPFIIGHECSGYVVETGDNVKDLKIGDRVVYWTVNGRAFADYCILDTEMAVGKISTGVSNDLCALMEMVTGSARLLYLPDKTALINSGDKIVVFGLGPAGLIYTKLAKLMGAESICAVVSSMSAAHFTTRSFPCFSKYVFSGSVSTWYVFSLCFIVSGSSSFLLMIAVPHESQTPDTRGGFIMR